MAENLKTSWIQQNKNPNIVSKIRCGSIFETVLLKTE